MRRRARLLASLEIAAGATLLAVAVITVVMVLLRKFLSASIPDWFDFSRLLQAIAITWGISLAAIEGAHICVDLLWEKAAGAWRRAIAITACAVEVGFYLLFSVMFFSAVQVAAGKGLVTVELRLAVWPFYLAAAIGSLPAIVAPLLLLFRPSDAALPMGEPA